MLGGQLVERYTQALYAAAAEAGVRAEVGDGLAQVAGVMRENKLLMEVLYSPAMPAVGKRETLAGIFAGVPQLLLNFLYLLVDKGREPLVIPVADRYRALLFEERSVAEAEVTTAYPLTDRQRQKLVARLTEMVNAPDRGGEVKVVLKEKIDPGMVGGIIVRMGDRLIDGSVGRQLAALSRRLLAG
ncbi:MAG: ATP synthase F1 subunit delta [Negativicutes bacterium]|nr:ATP synthase F1 subunit delta [Negativicutes bacterium]